ncbi:MAG: MFS transporter [Croceibacterium sp.]
MTDVEQSAYRKIMTRVSAVLALLIVVSSLDRVNISFAALRMNRDIGLSPSAYGFGAGLFFVSYLIFQLPSVSLLRRWGVRRWIALSVGGWGTVSVMMAFMTQPVHFYILRFMLGVFESGFAPGVVWFVSRWLPQRYRGRSIGLTLLAVPTSVIIGGPLCGWLMSLGLFGLPGWRVMFVVLGSLTILIAVGTAAWFVDGPDRAPWLTEAERQWANQAISAEQVGVPSESLSLRRPFVWLAAIIWLALVTGANALIFWLPSVISAAGVADPLVVGLLNALPWVAIGLGMILNSRHSDLSGERFAHVRLATLLAAAGLAAAAGAGGGALSLVLLVVGSFGLGGAQSVFWTIPTRFLGAAGPASIAFINLCGNTSSAVTPAIIGWAIESTGSPVIPVIGLSLLLLLAGVLTVPLQRTAPTRIANEIVDDRRGGS